MSTAAELDAGPAQVRVVATPQRRDLRPAIRRLVLGDVPVIVEICSAGIAG